jgi:hypothetical protein
MGRITPGGERSFYFRYTTSTGQRDTLAVGTYAPKGRDGYRHGRRLAVSGGGA